MAAITPRRIVITGIGPVTPLGDSVDSLYQGVLAGTPAVGPITAFDASGLPARIAAEIKGFDAKKYVEKNRRKALRDMARTIQLSVAAAQLAMDNGKVDRAKLDPTRFGVEFGSGLIASELPELADAAAASVNGQVNRIDLEAWGKKGLHVIQPTWMLKYLPNLPAGHISILQDAQGPNNSITESDVSGLLALGEACRIMRRNSADFFLVGGGESKINPLSMVRQSLFEQLSTRNEEPTKASRPFDAGRDGFVLGEAAVVLVVEALDHAEKRGAEILAEVVGFGSAFDRGLDGTGLARAIHAALKQANVTPADLDHVNAHGLSTTKEDAWEAKGIAAVVGTDVPVYSAKGQLGQTGAASGPLELAISVLALTRGELPATLNHDATDPACPIRVHAGSPRHVTKPYALKVGLTHTGQCAAVVVRKWS